MKNPYRKDEQDWFERHLWLLIFAVGIIALLVLWNFPLSAQTKTRYYSESYKIRIDGSNGTLKPVDIFYPGGGFVSLNWAICNTWATMAVDSGHIACRVSYPTTFLYPTRAAAIKGIEYAARSIKWVKDNWKEFGFDTTKITTYGTSAGGFCAMAPYMFPGNNVACIVNGWGGVLDSVYLKGAKIPVFNISTDYDKTVPIGAGNSFGVECYGSKFISEHLTVLGVRNSWLVYEGYKHGLLPKDSEYIFRIRNCYIQAQKFCREK